MPKVNHRRGFRAKMYVYGGMSSGSHSDYQPPYKTEDGVTHYHGPGNQHRATPDKSMQGWGDTAQIADKRVGAGIGNDFANGNRGMARAVRGAKKFVRSRLRFHDNNATRKLAENRDEV